MPILHFLAASQPVASAGPDVSISPRQALVDHRPIIEVDITVLPVVAQQLAQQGQPKLFEMWPGLHQTQTAGHFAELRVYSPESALHRETREIEAHSWRQQRRIGRDGQLMKRKCGRCTARTSPRSETRRHVDACPDLES